MADYVETLHNELNCGVIVPRKKSPDDKSKSKADETLEDREESENPHRSAADYLPKNPSLDNMREAVQKCHGCDLYQNATQAVFGEGPKTARIMFIGEQPGDKEDIEGQPFVGPAGKLLSKAMDLAGITRDTAYFTNAVKHFKYESRGKRRIHAKPRRIEVLACMPWLEMEIAQVQPDVVVCLGATAAQALFGPRFRLTQHRGELLESPLAPRMIATIHPSAILRARDDESRHAEMDAFVDDLKTVAQLLTDE